MALVALEVVEGLPAIEANAVPFDLDVLKPTVAFMVLDDSYSDISLDAMKDLPFLVTIAVNAADANAADWSSRVF